MALCNKLLRSFGKTWSLIAIHQQQISYSSTTKVPKTCAWTEVTEDKLPPPVEISSELLAYLERTSLVLFNNDDGVKQLKAAIRFADQLQLLDTEDVQPLTSLHENEVLYLREDKVQEGNIRDELLSCAAKTVEEWYYVTPPGNIPMQKKKKDEC